MEAIQYKVVVNHEGRYGLWPGYRPVPPGWSDTGLAGSKLDCLAHLEACWTAAPWGGGSRCESGQNNERGDRDSGFA